ncbi:LPS export ABC transporter ATP-binding protein [bacterium]|nr:LPS export ABC transporter ATP-binding protein [bacterium]
MAFISEQVLEARGLVKSFRSRKVVSGVSLSLKQGEVVGLLGPNGAGKTTIFKIMAGLVRPNEGKIFLNSQDITNEPMYKRARMGLGYLPQEPSVFRRLSVEDNLMAIMEAVPVNRIQRKGGLDSIIQELDLSSVRHQKADTLSGGERRRLEIARAIVPEPQFMLMDEPFAGIDPKSVLGMQDIVSQLKKKGIGMIITDHNVRETLAITDRSYIIFEGRVLIEGTSFELVNDPKAKEVYLGERFML